jgi:hypothetical protein
MFVGFNLGAGATALGTPGVWTGSYLNGPTGATNIVSTNGATFYITGVQLEVGTVATPYEMQIYSDQLAQCLRYYYKITNNTTGYIYIQGAGRSINATYGDFGFPLPVPMRVNPTLSYSSLNDFQCNFAGTLTILNLSANQSTGIIAAVLLGVGPGNATGGLVQILQFNNNTPSSAAYLSFSAEL